MGRYLPTTRTNERLYPLYTITVSLALLRSINVLVINSEVDRSRSNISVFQNAVQLALSINIIVSPVTKIHSVLTDVSHICATLHQLQRGVPDSPVVVLQVRLSHLSDFVECTAGPSFHQQCQIWREELPDAQIDQSQHLK